jgi:hypothetical protein
MAKKSPVALIRTSLENYDALDSSKKTGVVYVEGIGKIQEDKLRSLLDEHNELAQMIEKAGIISIEACGDITGVAYGAAIKAVYGKMMSRDTDGIKKHIEERMAGYTRERAARHSR